MLKVKDVSLSFVSCFLALCYVFFLLVKAAGQASYEYCMVSWIMSPFGSWLRNRQAVSRFNL